MSGVKRKDYLSLSAQARSALRKAGCWTMSDLNAVSVDSLSEIPGIDTTTLVEIMRVLRRAGSSLYDQSRAQPKMAIPPRLQHPPPGTPDPEEIPLVGEMGELGGLGLSARPAKRLELHGIHTLSNLCNYTKKELGALRGLGRTSLAEISAALALRGLKLAKWPVSSVAPAEATSLAGWLDALLGLVPERQRAVLRLRHGLDGRAAMTLAEVGRRFQLTRERARQIEKRAREVLNSLGPKLLLHLSDRLQTLLHARGGVARTEDLAESLGQLYPACGMDPVAFTRFVLPFCQGIENWEPDVWALSGLKDYQRAVKGMEESLKRYGHPLRIEELLESATNQFTGLDPRFLEEAVERTGRLSVRGGWVFRTAADLQRTQKSQWVLAALHSMGRPAHFSEVGQKVRLTVPELADISDHAIDKILLRLTGQVERTDRGTFGLRRWGVTADVALPDLLEEAVETRGSPLTVAELLSYVRARKSCADRSARTLLEADPRFVLLRYNLYTLASLAVPREIARRLFELQSVPLRPHWILAVIDLLVEQGRVSRIQLQANLNGYRQATRVDDYVRYLVDDGWAELQHDSLLPTDQARALSEGGDDRAHRLFRFAMSDPNFQVCLTLLLVEFLQREAWGGRAQRVEDLMSSALAPLRDIYALFSERLSSLGFGPTRTEEQERQLLQVLRGPTVSLVFWRWAQPVLGAVPSKTMRLIEGITRYQETFPSLPSRIRLRQISRPDARLLTQALIYAAEADAAVDFGRLVEYASLSGVEMATLPLLSVYLLTYGLIIDDRSPSDVRLLSPHLFIAQADELAAFGTGNFRSEWWRHGVLRALASSTNWCGAGHAKESC